MTSPFNFALTPSMPVTPEGMFPAAQAGAARPGFLQRFQDMRRNNPEALIALGAGMMQGDMAGGFMAAGQQMANYRKRMAEEQQKNKTAEYISRKLKIPMEDALVITQDPRLLADALRPGGGDTPDAVRTLQMRAQMAGLQPGTKEYSDFMVSGGKGALVNVEIGGAEKFSEEFAKGDAQALAGVAQAGLEAQRNLGEINRLGSLLSATPQGAVASWQQIAGNYGINTAGLDNIQAAQALINSLVPKQRPPGSGPMSDADLELFKQSLPRIINQPGGNELILNTMRAIAQYDAEGAAIVQALRRGEIDRAQAFEMLQNRANPIDGLKDISGSAPSAGSASPRRRFNPATGRIE